jgi:DNA polymerase-3 subunit delta
MLAERLGNRPVRLANELDRLALWAGANGRVATTDLESMLADTSETASWALSDALLDGDGARALAIAERLVAQEESLTGLLYGLASRLRKAQRAIAGLEAGRTQKEIEASLEMHPYAARKLLAGVRDADQAALRAATCALADLEVWTRGGADYEEDVALTLALRRAAGVAS